MSSSADQAPGGDRQPLVQHHHPLQEASDDLEVGPPARPSEESAAGTPAVPALPAAPTAEPAADAGAIVPAQGRDDAGGAGGPTAPPAAAPAAAPAAEPPTPTPCDELAVRVLMGAALKSLGLTHLALLVPPAVMALILVMKVMAFVAGLLVYFAPATAASAWLTAILWLANRAMHRAVVARSDRRGLRGLFVSLLVHVPAACLLPSFGPALAFKDALHAHRTVWRVGSLDLLVRVLSMTAKVGFTACCQPPALDARRLAPLFQLWEVGVGVVRTLLPVAFWLHWLWFGLWQLDMCAEPSDPVEYTRRAHVRMSSVEECAAADGWRHFALYWAAAAYLPWKLANVLAALGAVAAWLGRSKRPQVPCGRYASEEELSALGEDTTCSICYEELSRPVALTPCKHIFCEQCLVLWANREPGGSRTAGAGASGRMRTCPLCRSPIDEASEQGAVGDARKFTHDWYRADGTTPLHPQLL